MADVEVLKEKQVAERLGYKSQTLAKWRMEGKGPKYSKVGKCGVRYLWSDVIDWMQKHSVEST